MTVCSESSCFLLGDGLLLWMAIIVADVVVDGGGEGEGDGEGVFLFVVVAVVADVVDGGGGFRLLLLLDTFSFFLVS